MKTKITHNILTNEITEVPLNEEELELHNKTAEQESKNYDEFKAQAAAKKAAAEAKLVALGLDADDLKALGL